MPILTFIDSRQFTIVEATLAAPAGVILSTATSDSAVVCWDPVPYAASYLVSGLPTGATYSVGGSNVGGYCATILGLSAATSYTISIVAVDQYGGGGLPASFTFTTTPATAVVAAPQVFPTSLTYFGPVTALGQRWGYTEVVWNNPAGATMLELASDVPILVAQGATNFDAGVFISGPSTLTTIQTLPTDIYILAPFATTVHMWFSGCDANGCGPALALDFTTPVAPPVLTGVQIVYGQYYPDYLEYASTVTVEFAGSASATVHGFIQIPGGGGHGWSGGPVQSGQSVVVGWSGPASYAVWIVDNATGAASGQTPLLSMFGDTWTGAV